MYNTGNPIGSTAPKDFSDNAEITDRYVNDVVNETTQDRFGRSRLTIHGQQEKARRSFEQFESSAANVIANLGFFPPVDYTSGLTVDSSNFTTTYNGIVYAAQPSAVPFTTGAWDAAQWYPIQNVLNQKNRLVFDTYAEASAAAATLPGGQVLEIVADETRNGRRTRYGVKMGYLDFLGGPGTWSVWDLGAIGDNITDDSEAFRKAAALEGQCVHIPWTPSGYKVSGTFEVKCRFIGLGKPRINLRVAAEKGFWLQTNSGMENVVIHRWVDEGADSGEFNNAIMIGEYYSPLGKEYKNIVVRDVELVGELGDFARTTIMGIMGNSFDWEISNVHARGYVSYLAMVHWGGDMDPLDVHGSYVSRSWHPRRGRFQDCSFTAPAPDSAAGGLYFSAAHDISVDGFYTNGVRNPLVIAVGDIGGLVAQGDSAGRILAGMNFKNIRLLNYVQSAVLLSGATGIRNGVQWIASDRYAFPSICIDGLEITRAVDSLIAPSRMINISNLQNVEITRFQGYTLNNDDASNITPCIYIDSSRNVSVKGEATVPVLAQIVGGHKCTIDVVATCTNRSATTSIGVQPVTRGITVTTAAAAISGATTVVLAGLSEPLMPGYMMRFSDGSIAFTTSSANTHETAELTMRCTALPKNLVLGESFLIVKACENIKVRGVFRNFYRALYTSLLAGYYARNIDVEAEFSGSYLTDIHLRNVKGFKLHGNRFRDGNTSNVSGGDNIRLTDVCTGGAIEANDFEDNYGAASRVEHNVYVAPTCSGIRSSGNFHNGSSVAAYYWPETSVAGARKNINADNWFAGGVVPFDPAVASQAVSTIGAMQFSTSAAIPASGSGNVADVAFDTAPAAGGKSGWRKVVGGAWKAFAAIDS